MRRYRLNGIYLTTRLDTKQITACVYSCSYLLFEDSSCVFSVPLFLVFIQDERKSLKNFVRYPLNSLF